MLEAPDVTDASTIETAARETAIDRLLESNRSLWRGCNRDRLDSEGIATGFALLDKALPEQGWPLQGVIEVLSKQPGIGELQLFVPLMRELIARGRWILWIAPPYSPYAPALAQAGIDLRRILVLGQAEATEGPPKKSARGIPANEALWSMEKALQVQHCGLVMAWRDALPQRQLRRLQLAAMTGNTLGILFMRKNSEHSPSSMSLKIEAFRRGAEEITAIVVLKAKGCFQPKTVHIQLTGARP